MFKMSSNHLWVIVMSVPLPVGRDLGFTRAVDAKPSPMPTREESFVFGFLLDLFISANECILLINSFILSHCAMCKIMLYSCAVVRYKGERVLADGEVVQSGNAEEGVK